MIQYCYPKQLNTVTLDNSLLLFKSIQNYYPKLLY